MKYEITLDFVNYFKGHKEGLARIDNILTKFVFYCENEIARIGDKVYPLDEIMRSLTKISWKYDLKSNEEAKKMARHLVEKSQDDLKRQYIPPQEIPVTIYRLEKILVE